MLITIEDPKEKVSWLEITGKIVLFFLILYFSFNLLSTSRPWIIIDGVNLLIHEVGHFVFAFLGETMGFLGGTLLQLIVPFGILIYFLLKAELFSVTFALFWVGDNLINIAAYIKDARAQALDLVGGGIHDWNFLLGKWGLLNSDQVMGSFFHIVGTIFILTAILVMGIIILRNINLKLQII